MTKRKRKKREASKVRTPTPFLLANHLNDVADHEQKKTLGPQ